MRLCLSLVFLLIAGLGLLAQRAGTTFEKLQIADTAVGFATATLEPPGVSQITTCEARLETAQARYRFDGGAVSATTGMLLEMGDVLEVGNHADARALRLVKTGSTTGVLSVSCWP